MKEGMIRRALGRWFGMALVMALTGIAAVDDLSARATMAATFTVTTLTGGTTLNFVTGLGINPVAQRLTLKNGPSGLLNWKTTVTTTTGGAWLSVKPTKGRTQKNRSRKLNVTVDVITTALPASGTLYTGQIVFQEKTNASNSVTINVTLRVTDKATPAFYTTDTTGALIPTSVLAFDAAFDGTTGSTRWLRS